MKEVYAKITHFSIFGLFVPEVFEPPVSRISGGSNRCFIAIAAYVSYTNQHPIPSPSASYGAGGLKSRISTDNPITILQRFRDEHLLTNPVGRAFVAIYYKISPPIADFIRDKEPLKTIVRTGLKPIVWIAKRTTP